MAHTRREGLDSGQPLVLVARRPLQQLHMSRRRYAGIEPYYVCLQAFAAKTFPEAASKAARAVFPMHANLDDKIKEKFGGAVRDSSAKGSGDSESKMRFA